MIDSIDQPHTILEILTIIDKLAIRVLKLVIFLVNCLDPAKDCHLVTRVYVRD